MKVSRVIAAPRPHVFAAFADPAALARWLPPAGMTATLASFDARPGGGYLMTLIYGDPRRHGQGKTTADSDSVEVRFAAFSPERIVQQVAFRSDDAAFDGLMTMTWTFDETPAGTEVAVTVEDAPPGISDADHAAGIASSLDNLARFLGG